MAKDLKHENSSNSIDWNSVEYWEGVAESFLRITAAGFAGSLVGLAKERLYQTQPPVNETVYASSAAAAPSTTSKVLVYEPPNYSTAEVVSKQQVSLSKKLPRRPPQLPVRAMTSTSTSAFTNLPIVWSVSCMLFTIILESCRLSSPTNIILQIIESGTTDNTPPEDKDAASTSINFHNEVQRTAITSFGDYALGGTIAGLAGAIGQRQQQRHQLTQLPVASRIPTIRFGLATGFGLGVIAGTFQAAIDVSNLYLREKERQDQEIQERQEQDQDDQAAAKVEKKE